MSRLLTLTAVIVVLASCSPSLSAESTVTTSESSSSTTTTTTVPTTTTTQLPDFAVSSPAFEEGGAIPEEYTCNGLDFSPQLDIVGLPESTESVAIVAEDPDAPLGVWYHWVVYDVSAGAGSLEVPRNASGVGVQGVNSWNLDGYMGPCPPEGEEHGYVFNVYALDSVPGLPPGLHADETMAEIDDHIIDSTALTGVYGD